MTVRRACARGRCSRGAAAAAPGTAAAPPVGAAGGRQGTRSAAARGPAAPARPPPSQARRGAAGTAPRSRPGGSSAPVPLEALAERATRALGHEKTIGTSWAGAGTFRELLRQQLPAEIKLTSEPPYLAFDPKRHGEDGRATALEGREPGARQI